MSSSGSTYWLNARAFGDLVQEMRVDIRADAGRRSAVASRSCVHPGHDLILVRRARSASIRQKMMT